MLTRIIARLRAVLLGRFIRLEIDEELHDHVEREIAANLAAGLSYTEARRRALADLGGLAQTREAIHAVRGSRLAAAGQALSLRSLRRQPLYAASFILTLTLAVAAATTIGAVIKPTIFDPLPYRDDAALVMVNTAINNGLGTVNIHTLNDLRASSPPLMAISGSRGAGGSYTSADGVFLVNLVLVESHYFATLGVSPAMGRLWGENETNGVLVSWTFWQQTLNADTAAIGRAITIDGLDRIVLGVMPRRFVAPWNASAEVWAVLDPAPLLADPYRARRQLMVVARRAPGASLDQVAAHLAMFSARMAREHAKVPGGQTLVANPLRERLVGTSSTVINGMAAATLLLLLIVAANIAGLAAVRAIALRRETAVKIALGASRPRIIGERLGESALMALAASIAGAALSTVLVATLRQYQGEFLGALAPIELALSLALTAVMAGTLIGAVAGVLPHLSLKGRGSEDPLRASRGAAGDRTSSRLRMGLAAAQIALALVLIVGAGLLVRTLNHLSATPLGFDPDRLTAFFVNLPGPRYAKAPAQVQFEQALLERLERIPGVEAVTASIGIPVNGGMGAALYIEGREETGTPIHYMSVAPNFRELLGVPMLAGRTLDSRDVIGAQRTLVINETMAKRFWPDGNAVGARIFVGVTPSQNWMTVVGIVADTRQHGPGAEIMPTAFGSSRQYSWPQRHFVFRSADGRTVPAADLRAALREVDPALAVRNLSTFSALVTSQQATQRLVLFVLASFAVVAAVLCAFGLYGVLALTSSLRRHEYAIRLALGSTAERVRWLVVRHALILAGTGMIAGIGVAWLTTRVVQGLLEGVRPNDPLTFAGAATVIAVIALVASWVPAHRAAHVNAAEVLAADSHS